MNDTSKNIRRPLTVRWWFRVGLVCVALVGGYGAAYVVARDYSEFPQTAVITYPGGQRYYARSDEGWDEVLDRRVFYRAKHQLDPPGMRIVYHEWVRPDYFVEDEPSAWLFRAFYPAERVELALRGIEVYVVPDSAIANHEHFQELYDQGE